MLALAEVKTENEGLDWAFCDTDSMAIAKPENMDVTEFFERSKRVCEWFDPLNPYEKKGHVFKIEDANYKSGTETLEPLFTYCISSKRYVLFNYDEDGKPIVRKASAHGLGHFLPRLDVTIFAEAKEAYRARDILPHLEWAGGLLGVRIAYEAFDI